MNPELGELAEEYASALESYLAGRGDAALQEVLRPRTQDARQGTSACSTSRRSSTARC